MVLAGLFVETESVAAGMGPVAEVVYNSDCLFAPDIAEFDVDNLLAETVVAVVDLTVGKMFADTVVGHSNSVVAADVALSAAVDKAVVVVAVEIVIGQEVQTDLFVAVAERNFAVELVVFVEIVVALTAAVDILLVVAFAVSL